MNPKSVVSSSKSGIDGKENCCIGINELLFSFFRLFKNIMDFLSFDPKDFLSPNEASDCPILSTLVPSMLSFNVLWDFISFSEGPSKLSTVSEGGSIKEVDFYEANLLGFSFLLSITSLPPLLAAPFLEERKAYEPKRFYENNPSRDGNFGLEPDTDSGRK